MNESDLHQYIKELSSLSDEEFIARLEKDGVIIIKGKNRQRTRAEYKQKMKQAIKQVLRVYLPVAIGCALLSMYTDTEQNSLSAFLRYLVVGIAIAIGFLFCP